MEGRLKRRRRCLIKVESIGRLKMRRLCLIKKDSRQIKDEKEMFNKER